jgi:LacI family transcriptional regulator
MAKTLNVLVAGVDFFYARETLRGIQEYSQGHGRWQFHMCGKVLSKDTLRPFESGLSKWKPDGLIASIRDRELLEAIKKFRRPVVNFSSAFDANLPTVIADSVAIGQMGARHLLDRGFRNFAFTPDGAGLSGALRARGFSQEVANGGFACSVRHGKAIIEESDRQELVQWLVNLPKPIGIMAYLDDEAMEVVWACQLLGLRIPEDVAIVGVGNYDHAGSLWEPGLSSVEMGLNRVGYRAAEILHGMIQGKRPPSAPILVSPLEVVTRESTDIVATADQDVAQAVRIIRQRAHQLLSVKELLAEIPVSRRSLERRFLKVVGRSPRAEITRSHIELAKKLLRETQMPIPLVAQNSGFSNRMIFATFFRRKTGLTPSQYRTTVRLGIEPTPLPEPARRKARAKVGRGAGRQRS